MTLAPEHELVENYYSEQKAAVEAYVEKLQNVRKRTYG
jgi:hypothetical protein